MKLRSIAFAGLLGAGLLMTSGCTEEDVADIVKTNMVYAVNGLGTDITVNATGANPEDLAPNNVQTFALSGYETTDVYYTNTAGQSGTEHFSYGSAYLFAATDCEVSHGVITDKASGLGQIKIVNLTLSDLPSSTAAIVITDTAGGTHTVNATTAGKCDKTTSSILVGSLALEVGKDISVSVASGASHSITITKAIPTTIDIDVVVTGTDAGTIIPLASFGDAL